MYFNAWGHFSFTLSVGLATLQGILAFFYAKRMPTVTFKLLSTAQLFFILFAFGTLIHAYMVTDYSVLNVYMNSHVSKPLFYKVIALWGNHEGSMLLWLTVMSLLSTVLAWRPGPMDRLWHIKSLGVYACLYLLFFVYVSVLSNPFDRVWPVPTQGMDLNPLLQDPGLSFHPPVLYLGYVGFSLIYALTIGWALSAAQSIATFVQVVRPWTLFMWSGLTLGIVAGSWWAYYVLGWGGWWFWDPVENISLLPWLAALAFLHYLRRTPMMPTSGLLFLGCLPFVLGVGGTFLVRSGLLTSVHSFATDTARFHGLLLIFLAVFTGACTVFWRPFPQNTSDQLQPLTPVNQALTWQVRLTLFFLIIVITGLLYPLTMWLSGGPAFAVGGNYFEQFLLPLLLLGSLLLSFYAYRRCIFLWLFGALALGGCLLIVCTSVTALQVCGIASAVLFLISAVPFLRCTKNLSQKLMGLMHGSFGVLILAATLNGMLHQDTLLTLELGKKAYFGPYVYHLDTVHLVPGENYMAHQLTITIEKRGEELAILHPERRFFLTRPQLISDSKIVLDRWVNIQVIAGDQVKPGEWQVRVHQDPFILFIWIGGIMCSLLAFILAIMGLRMHRKGGRK